LTEKILAKNTTITPNLVVDELPVSLNHLDAGVTIMQKETDTLNKAHNNLLVALFLYHVVDDHPVIGA
jgi:hypothetical protein